MSALNTLAGRLHHAKPEDLPGIAEDAAISLGATATTLYLVDYSQVDLLAQVPANRPAPDPIPIDGTVAGRAYSTGVPTRIADLQTGGDQLWLPVVDGAERVGVFAVTLSAAAAADPAVQANLQTLTTLLGQILAARHGYGDALERTRRRLPMQLAAEIIWTQLPPLTFATDRATVAAILEPAYDVGGDAFDYAANGDTLHVALFDAVGHGIEASSLTALALSAYRNARRCGLDLSDTYRSIDKWVNAQHPGSFVTAVLAELDTPNGTYRKISAGHPGELLLRNGRCIAELPAPTAMPLGLGNLVDPIPGITEITLEPGDQLLLYTDGVVEARTDAGDLFGVERLTDFVTKALADQLPAAETMRRLVHAILAHQHERLQDDATAVLVEWNGAPVPAATDAPPPSLISNRSLPAPDALTVPSH
ncbi:PP2C family protein-serine/threonine phosphatase [Dactylosporangium sp. NPDC051541]|uniref:PP2C family protein-serine/threonine phosphatase n=1 Tax=Dactylosporangium sp. NPDC051541 TaxID=3363977 RepID=UPI0037B63EE3